MHEWGSQANWHSGWPKPSVARRLRRCSTSAADRGCLPSTSLSRSSGWIRSARCSIFSLSTPLTHCRSKPSLAHLPFATGSLGGALGANVYVHVSAACCRWRWQNSTVLQPDAPIELRVFEGDQDFEVSHDDSIGPPVFPVAPRRAACRHRWRWVQDRPPRPADGRRQVDDDRCFARRAHTLPDIVGPAMRLLMCGLNPSVYSADVGIGFGRPGNRFWPAALMAGVASVDRTPGMRWSTTVWA